MKNCCLSLVIQNLIIYTSEICLAESEIQQWNFFVESDKTMVSSNVITDSLKADSLLDCTRMCVDVLACCKASFNPLSNTCFLDTTDYCETPSTYSEGSKLATRITQGNVLLAIRLLQKPYSSPRHRWSYSILAILFRSFGVLAPKNVKIIWISNILALTVPDEGYSRNASCALNLISTFLLLFLNNVITNNYLSQA